MCKILDDKLVFKNQSVMILLWENCW